MAVDVDEYLESVDLLLGRLERDADLNAREVEAIRRDLVGDIRDIGASGAGRLRTARLGRIRILIPESENFRRIGLTSRRVKERFSRFKLEWLSKKDMRGLVDGPLDEISKKRFIRGSRRLARNARSFLKEIEELEPTLAEEVQATLRQIDDAEMDLLKLEVRSWTRVNENLRRMVNGRLTKAKATGALRRFDVNRNLFNLSLLEHPKAVVRDLFARASERMAQRVTRVAREIPRRAFVFVGAGPAAIQKMTKGSRTARFLWRLFSVEDLDRRFAKMAGRALATSTWRGLGLGFATPEFYIPVPPEIVSEVEKAMRARRREFLGGLQESMQGMPLPAELTVE